MSSEEHPEAVISLPEFPNENPHFDKERLRLFEEFRKGNYLEKATQTIEDNWPDKSLDNFHEQPLNVFPNKTSDNCSDKSSEESSDKSFHNGDTSPSYPSDDTEPMDIRESEAYINASSDKERRRLVRKQAKIDRIADKSCLRRKIRAGKKARALEHQDAARKRSITMRDWDRGPAFETEVSRVQQCRAMEDRARVLSEAGGADGRKWSDHDQRVAELQRVNEDYIKLGMELYRWRHKQREGKLALLYRADEVTKLLRIYDRQWRQAYERIGDNLVKVKEQMGHSAEQEDTIRGLDTIEKEPEAATDETTVQPETKEKSSPPPPDHHHHQKARTKKTGGSSATETSTPKASPKWQTAGTEGK